MDMVNIQATTLEKQLTEAMDKEAAEVKVGS